MCVLFKMAFPVVGTLALVFPKLGLEADVYVRIISWVGVDAGEVWRQKRKTFRSFSYWERLVVMSMWLANLMAKRAWDEAKQCVDWAQGRRVLRWVIFAEWQRRFLLTRGITALRSWPPTTGISLPKILEES